MDKLANVQDKRSFKHSKGLVACTTELFKDLNSEIQVTDPSMSEDRVLQG